VLLVRVLRVSELVARPGWFSGGLRSRGLRARRRRADRRPQEEGAREALSPCARAARERARQTRSAREAGVGGVRPVRGGEHREDRAGRLGRSVHRGRARYRPTLMRFADALKRLDARQPEHMPGPSLERIREVAALLDQPQLTYPTIHVT